MSLYKMPNINCKTYSLVYYFNKKNAVMIINSSRYAFLQHGKVKHLKKGEILKCIKRPDENSALWRSDLIFEWKKDMEKRNHTVILMNCPYNI